MRMLAIAAIAVGLVGCGNAESIDPAEIDAENVRRADARTAEVTAAEKVRAAEDEIHLSGPADLDVANNANRGAEQVTAPREKVAPPEGQ